MARIQFKGKVQTMIFRNAVYVSDVAAWKRARRESREARSSGYMVMRPLKIRRPEMLAINWCSLSLRFIARYGDFEREAINRAGRLS